MPTPAVAGWGGSEMGRTLRRAWLPVVGVCGLLAGCEHNRASHYPPDPLLVSKRPVESRGEANTPPTVARREPPTPERLVAAASPHEGADNSAVPASMRPGHEDDQ
jgi:hypothetical protein